MYQIQVLEKVNGKVVKSSNLEKSMMSNNPVKLNLYNTQEGSKMTVLIHANKTVMVFSPKDTMTFDWTKKEANQWLVESIAELGYELVG
jgi:uncharacterized pyridoxamine 5'-phosphate oxidase family protein